MLVPYPTSLPKYTAKIQEQAYTSTSDPVRGMPYIEPKGTDQPVYVTLTWKLTQDQIARLRLWFEVPGPTGLHRGRNSFTVELETEFGMVDHELFVESKPVERGRTANVWNWQMECRARKLITPQGYIDAAPLIVGLEDWKKWAYWLDLSVQAMPEA